MTTTEICILIVVLIALFMCAAGEREDRLKKKAIEADTEAIAQDCTQRLKVIAHRHCGCMDCTKPRADD